MGTTTNDKIIAALGANRVKARLLALLPEIQGKRPNSGGWVTIKCPLNPTAHSHQDKNPSFGLNLNHGGYSCKGCGAKGNFLKLNAALEQTAPKIVAKRLSDELGLGKSDHTKPKKKHQWKLILAELLKAKVSGISESFLQENFKLVNTMGKGVFMPYFDETGQKIICRKYRRQIPKTKPDRRFHIEAGDQHELYGIWLSQTKNSSDCYLVEGETDTWVLAYHGYPVIGLPGAQSMATKHGLRFAEYLKRFQKLYICREPDTANEGLVRSLSARLAEVEYEGELYAITLDAADVVESFGKEPATFNDRFAQFTREPISIEPMTVIERIVELRSCKELPKHQRHRDIAHIVIEDLSQKGQFYHANQQSYLFYQHKLYRLDRDCQETVTLLSHLYDQNATEEEFKFLLTALNTHCFIYGNEAEVHRLTHFSDSLYINRFDSYLYRLDGKKIECLPNGTDGVLFLGNPLATPYELDKDKNRQQEALQQFRARTSFMTSKDSALSAEEQQYVLFIWLLSLFFDTRLITRPILVLVGPKGSIKTSTLRRILRIIFGPKVDLMAMPDEQDDFDIALANNYLVFFDNVDTNNAWLNDRLAAVATGHQIVRRELYTTAEQRAILIDCFLALTSRTPHFKRDDVADRTLILSLDRPDAFVPERVLHEETQRDRDAFLGAIFNHLNTIVCYLQGNPKLQSSTFRIADWAELSSAIVRTLGMDQEQWRNILNKLQTEQEYLALDGDPLLPAMESWLSNGVRHDAEYTTKELHEHLQNAADNEGITWSYKNTISLGNRLSNVRNTLEKCLGISIMVRSGRSRTKLYRFSKKEVNYEENREDI